MFRVSGFRVWAWVLKHKDPCIQVLFLEYRRAPYRHRLWTWSSLFEVEIQGLGLKGSGLRLQVQSLGLKIVGIWGFPKIGVPF